MKDMGEMLLRPEAFSEIVIGNTALVRAMVESRSRGGHLLSRVADAGDRHGHRQHAGGAGGLFISNSR